MLILRFFKVNVFLFRKINLFCFFLWCMAGCHFINNNHSVKIINQEIIATPTPQPVENVNETIDKNYVLLLLEKDSPIRILDITATSKNYDFKKGIDVEVKNVSDKDIINIQIGIAPPPKCLSFYKIGDWVINSKNEKQENAFISPSSNFSIHISSDIAESYLSPQNYSNSCPHENNKPIVYIWGVEFKDNTNWKSKVWENKDG